jgi:hypothetical protein
MPEDDFTAAVVALACDSTTHPRLRNAERLAWAIEEALHVGSDGREYLVANRADDDWTVSIGWSNVVAEVVFVVDPAVADAVAALQEADHSNVDGWPVLRIEWLGPADRAPQDTVAGDNLRIVPAVSVTRLEELLESAFASVRPDVTFVHDPGWIHHRHPVGSLLNR